MVMKRKYLPKTVSGRLSITRAGSQSNDTEIESNTDSILAFMAAMFTLPSCVFVSVVVVVVHSYFSHEPEYYGMGFPTFSRSMSK
jgi:hypothetical protein